MPPNLTLASVLFDRGHLVALAYALRPIIQ